MKKSILLVLMLCGVAHASDIYTDQNHNGFRVYGLPTPTTANDAATKAYVDTHVVVGGTPSPTPAKTPVPALTWYGNPTSVPADPIFNATTLPPALMPATTGDVTKPAGSTVTTVVNVSGNALPAFTGDVTKPSGSTVQSIVSVPPAALPALTGDVTMPPGSTVTTLTNIPDAVTLSGGLIATGRVAPSNPASGSAYLYVDAATKNWATKNDAGVVTHGVQTKTKAANSWIESIADNGSVNVTQPFFSNLGGSISISQMNSGTGASATTFWRGDNTWSAVAAPTTINGSTITGSTISTTRINPRVTSIVSANLTPSATTDDIYVATFLSADVAISNPTGSPANGQLLIIRIKDNGTKRLLTWGTQYRGTMFSSTIPTHTQYYEFRWNANDNYWDETLSADVPSTPSPAERVVIATQPAATAPRATPKQSPTPKNK